MLVGFLTVIHVLVVLFLILVVLVQGGNQGGMGAAFGGGNSAGFFGATGAATLLTKLTYGAAIIFMVTSISLTMIQGRSGSVGLKEKLEKSTSAPVSEPAAPAAGAPASSAPAAPQSESAPKP